MKKAFKPILVMILVALFAIATIPSVSAADPTLVVKNANEDFTFNLYTVATLDLETGKYTPKAGVDSSIVTAINTANQSGADFLAVLDAVTDNSKLGTLNENIITGKVPENGENYVPEVTITEPGIYYVKVKDQPSDNVSKVRNSVIVWPEYKNKKWDYSFTELDLATKVGTDRITKYFTDDVNAEYQCKGQGDTVKFTLRADVVGNAAEPATKYQIWDKMSPGLKYKENSVAIKYEDGTDASADFETPSIDEDGLKEDSDPYYKGGTFFQFNAKTNATGQVDSAAFYAHKEVVITYEATVLNSAGIGKNYNPNLDGLVYRLTGQNFDTVRPGKEKKVYTFSAEANKIDASATAKAKAENPQAGNTPLKGAVVGLYSDAACTKLLASGTSGDDGKVEFKVEGDANTIRLAPGKYYVKEISAPAGYVLSTVVYDLTVSADLNGNGMFNLDDNKVIENFATKMPETGGQGTWMFTLIGAGLILCAGILFIIVMRKKSSK